MEHINPKEIILFLNSILNNKEIEDFSSNGLQIERKEPIQKIAFAVDASKSTIKKAIERNADLLVVHHGLFWPSINKIKGNSYEKISLAIKNQLGIYASHLPLDMNIHYGNNINFAKFIDLQNIRFEIKHQNGNIAVVGHLKIPMQYENLKRILEEKFKIEIKGEKFKDEIQSVCFISGSGSSFIEDVKRLNVDLFITGEYKYENYIKSIELEQSFMIIGHYNSEMFGVLSLKKAIDAKFDVETEFIEDKINF